MANPMVEHSDLNSFLDTLNLTIKPCANTQEEIILYGAGDLGQLAYDFCQSSGIRIKCFLDRNCAVGKSSSLHNINIINPTCQSDPLLLRTPVFVSVATSSYEAIKKKLLYHGWENVFPFYQLAQNEHVQYPLSNGWLIKNLTEEEIDRIKYVHDHLEDEESRRQYKAFIAWHASYQEIDDPHYPINPSDRYAIDPLLNTLRTRRQNVIDVGAHHGQLLKILLSKGIQIKSYDAFEPDPKTCQELIDAIENSTLSECDFRCHSICISSHPKATLRFENGRGYCSRISEFGSISVNTTTIDSLDLSPTLIKLHTEGTELDCLKGAFKTITKQNPVVVCALYHNRQGLYETVSYFMNSFPNYYFFLRLHSYQGTGFFLYAIPKT